MTIPLPREWALEPTLTTIWEIITIVKEGALEHKDSMGNIGVIRENEIQVMSAGSGITHSEYNHSKEHPVKLFQIWVYANKRNVEPRYDQIMLNPEDRKNKLQQIVSPFPEKKVCGYTRMHRSIWAVLKGNIGQFSRNKAKSRGLHFFD